MSAARVGPGYANARKPSAMATIPRRMNSHESRLRLADMGNTSRIRCAMVGREPQRPPSSRRWLPSNDWFIHRSSPRSCVGPGATHAAISGHLTDDGDHGVAETRAVITFRPSSSIHHTEGGWFRANWHFSFDTYVDPENTWFGDLR